MKRKKTDIVQFKVRLRESLRKQLEDEARAKDISLNNEIVERLVVSFHDAAVQTELKKLAERFDKEIARREGEMVKAESEGRIERVEMPPERVEALMAVNKDLETRLTAAVSDVEKLKAQLTAILEAHQSKGE